MKGDINKELNGVDKVLRSEVMKGETIMITGFENMELCADENSLNVFSSSETKYANNIKEESVLTHNLQVNQIDMIPLKEDREIIRDYAITSNSSQSTLSGINVISEER